nr:multiple epidermal growth factor-like domains protein 10 isoform X1 [Onthophagus taurus]
MITLFHLYILVCFLISPIYSVLSNDGICVTTKREKEIITLSSGKTIEKEVWILVEECCKGYNRYNNVSNKCEPICEPNCRFGTCVSPNECQCFPEYHGKLCEKESTDCNDGFWGANCTKECDCNGFNCRQMNGKCMCGDGFMGKHCESDCGKNTFGFNCTSICDCVNGVCNKITGSCTCYFGYMGKNCSIKIPESTTTIKIYTSSPDENNNIFINPIISYCILGIVLLTAIIIVIYFQCLKRKSYGMVNLYAAKMALPAPNPGSFENISDHDYESIQYAPLPKHISDPKYYRGYEIPCTVPINAKYS